MMHLTKAAFRNSFAVAIAALMALTLVGSQAAAQSAPQELSPEHLSVARKYIELTQDGPIFATVVVQVGVDTMRTITQQNPEIGDELENSVTETINSYAGKDGDLLDKFARLYAVRFTQEELQQIVEFYETDVGQKLVSKRSEIAKDTQVLLGVFTDNLRTEFFAKVRASLREKGIDI